MKHFKVQIEDLVFDLEDGDEPIPFEEEVKLQNMLRERYINKIYEIEAETDEDAHDAVLDIVTDETGWCIYSIDTMQV